MEKYSLEVANWGQWELERDFSSLDRAKHYGFERFSQNEWRIFDRVAGEIVFHYDPISALEQEASAEIRRFNENERWRRIFAERRAQDVMAQQQRERLAEIAARQRQQQRQRAIQQSVQSQERRRERLRGFSFVGIRPSLLDLVHVEDAEYEIDEYGVARKLSGHEDRINWLKEGF